MKEISKTQIANKQEGLKTLWSFECPSCSTIVNRPLSDGRKSNSCGSFECKMTIADLKNPRIASQPFYSAIAMQYKYLKDNYIIDKEWNTLSKFYSSIYATYSNIRKTSSKVRIHINGEVASSSTVTFVGKKGDARLHNDGIVGIDCTVGNPTGYYDTLQVSYIIGTTHANVRRRLRKLQTTANFTNTPKCTVLSTGERKCKVAAELLSEVQYRELITSMQATVIKNKPNNLYLLQGAGLTKIGISSDVRSRVSKLTTSSPVSLTLLTHYPFIDARKIEKELHEKYKEYNSHGEWFNLTPAQIKEITDYLDNKVK